MNEKWTRGAITVAIAMLAGTPSEATMPVPPQGPQPGLAMELAPHRAIYDMVLSKAAAGANVGEVRGRLVFEFLGSACEGYTLNMRLVTEIVDRDGRPTTSDLRSSTWEHAKGDKFRFSSSQYLNQRLSEQVAGLASRGRDGGNVSISLEKPTKRNVKIGGASMFPTQHSIAILEAAQHGRSFVQADIYDGTEKGEKYYETTTFIGKPLASTESDSLKSVPNADKLDGMMSWPVSISYYETDPGKKARDEGTPTYELSFRLYANGVSRRLQIDYGNFAIAGELTRIDFMEPGKCTDGKGDKQQ